MGFFSWIKGLFSSKSKPQTENYVYSYASNTGYSRSYADHIPTSNTCGYGYSHRNVYGDGYGNRSGYGNGFGSGYSTAKCDVHSAVETISKAPCVQVNRRATIEIPKPQTFLQMQKLDEFPIPQLFNLIQSEEDVSQKLFDQIE